MSLRSPADGRPSLQTPIKIKLRRVPCAPDLVKTHNLMTTLAVHPLIMQIAMITSQEAVLDLHPAVVAKVADAIEAEARVTVVHPVAHPALPEAQRSIVVEKLTKNVTEAHLREIFGSFGDIEHLELPMNRAFMTNRGTAYIIYYDPADAEAAIAHMHEAQLDGAVLNVSIILPRRAFSRSPPPAANRGNGRGRFGKGSFANSPPRRHGRGARPAERHDTYRPQSRSRSRSPIRSRSYSRQQSPPRRGSTRDESPRQRRRRSPSYSSYSSRSERSRSPNRSRSPSRSRNRR
ncbi:uncharacterized protein N7483_005551 [Penicillium malachiteum]|uniref:uncharacterized protein n=1 Tax=Penicillium malachiteum TaxID=1324776 RepID=UPI00254675B9|nr:uncharacterized protein N7483_005551 [Penicillium malachiteum]KAJ5731043.1 hypothetical protein N7483_005551 [Penicillium malachiteum]